MILLVSGRWDGLHCRRGAENIVVVPALRGHASDCNCCLLGDEENWRVLVPPAGINVSRETRRGLNPFGEREAMIGTGRIVTFSPTKKLTLLRALVCECFT